MIVVHGLDEGDGRTELRPPVVVLSLQLVADKRVHVLDGRHQVRRIGLQTMVFKRVYNMLAA